MKPLAIFGGVVLLLLVALWIASKALQKSGFVADKDGKLVKKSDLEKAAFQKEWDDNEAALKKWGF